MDTPALNPIQQSVLAALSKKPDYTPTPPELANNVEHHLYEALEPIADHYSPDNPLWITKHALNTVHGCEAHHVATRGSFAWSLASVRGTVAHKAIELLLNMRSSRTPGELVDDALDRIVESERGSASDFIAGLSPAEQADLRASVVDLVTTYEDSFPMLESRWRPVTESPAKVVLFDGAVVLSTRADLVIGHPGYKVIIDMKTGRITGGHREDLRFYALVETLRARQAPRLTATFSLETQRIDTEDVTINTLSAAVHRLVAGAQLLYELDHDKRAPQRRTGPPCRWCPIVGSCAEGTAYVTGETDDPDGF
jgi:PD-(D/E)XK nuclease superfamily